MEASPVRLRNVDSASALLMNSCSSRSRQVVGMRNRVVHSYFEVDLDVLWAVVTLDVPELRAQLAAIPDEK